MSSTDWGPHRGRTTQRGREAWVLERAAGRGPMSTAAAERLRATGPSPALQRLTDLTARLLAAPSAQVSLLTDEQHVAAGAGTLSCSVGTHGPLGESVCHVVAELGGVLVVSDAAADQRVAQLPAVRSGEVAAFLGAPLTGEAGVVVGVLCVFDAVPRTWSDTDVLLVEQLAMSVLAELELSALTDDLRVEGARLELAVAAAGIGSWDLDLVTDALTWDDRLVELFGYDRETFTETLQAFDDRLHPEDADRVGAELAASIEAVGAFHSQYRVLRPSGEVVWVESRGRAMPEPGTAGPAVRVLGVAYDTTATHEAEARVARVLETMPAGFVAVDRELRVTDVNGLLARSLGLDAGVLRGRALAEVLPTDDPDALVSLCRRALGAGEAATAEVSGRAPFAGWYEVRAWPTPDGISLYLVDVTDRHEAAVIADRSMWRALLLSEATSALSGPLDPAAAAGELARVLVPSLADCCFVTLVDDGPGALWTRLRDVGWWHAEMRLRPAARRYSETRVAALSEGSELAQALTGLRHVSTDATARLSAFLLPGPARETLAELEPACALLVPLTSRGRVLGLLTLFRGAESQPFDDHDLHTAEEVAARAGLAMAAAQVSTQQRALAEELQRAVLTAPPQPEHLEIAVRYDSAVEAARIGGDWYDAFLQPSGATMVVIGDVVGHDNAAAASMGQVRGLLRGVAATTDEGPAAVLGRLDAAMRVLQLGLTATAVVASVQRDGETGVHTLRWSNAGHPPGLVLRADGSVQTLAARDADLLLGIDPDTAREESSRTLAPGETLLLYTDGLVERRGQDLDEGLARLAAALAERRDLGLEQLCDALLAEMLPERPEDDVALLAIRAV